MKTTLVALLAIAALAPPALALADVHVTLDIDLSGLDYKSCDVTVPEGSDAAAVLDAAVASDCISEWSWSSFEGFGRYVTSIDHLPGLVATYWAFYVNGAYADVGIDAYSAREGDTVRFNYEQWVVALP